MATDAAPDDVAHRPRGRPARSDVERREVQLRVARAAMTLFSERGSAATSASQIAAAAGISTRTFWRHFPSKEAAIRPFLDHGLRDALGRMSDLAPGRPLSSAWRGPSTLSPREQRELVDLVALVQDEPAVRAVWLQAHYDAASAFVDVVARQRGVARESLEAEVASAALNAALATAVERYATAGRAGESLNEVIEAAVRLAVD